MNTKNTVKVKVTGVLLGVASLLGVGLVNASSVSVLPSSLPVAPGDTFSANVQADFSDVGGTSQGSFLLSWDPSVLTLVAPNGRSAEITAILTAQFLDPNVIAPGFTITTIDSAAGTLQFDMSLCPLGADCDVVLNSNLYNLTFEVAQTAATGPTQATLALGAGGAWLGADGLTELPAPTYNAATFTVNAVPVPAAVWLFGSGLIGMIAVSRRRKPQLVC